MKNIEVKKCTECPFRYDDFDDFSMGDDTVMVCSLANHLRLPNIFIGSYSSWDEEKSCSELPEWCPLKNEDYKISFKI